MLTAAKGKALQEKAPKRLIIIIHIVPTFWNCNFEISIPHRLHNQRPRKQLIVEFEIILFNNSTYAILYTSFLSFLYFLLNESVRK